MKLHFEACDELKLRKINCDIDLSVQELAESANLGNGNGQSLMAIINMLRESHSESMAFNRRRHELELKQQELELKQEEKRYYDSCKCKSE